MQALPAIAHPLCLQSHDEKSRPPYRLHGHAGQAAQEDGGAHHQDRAQVRAGHDDPPRRRQAVHTRDPGRRQGRRRRHLGMDAGAEPAPRERDDAALEAARLQRQHDVDHREAAADHRHGVVVGRAGLEPERRDAERLGLLEQPARDLQSQNTVSGRRLDTRGRRRGGGEHGHCDTIKEGNSKSSFGTLNESIWDEFLIVSPFLESLIRSLGSWPHC